jgi:hypothetical protein
MEVIAEQRVGQNADTAVVCDLPDLLLQDLLAVVIQQPFPVNCPANNMIRSHGIFRTELQARVSHGMTGV